jgi:hypothetical protein
MDPIVTFDEAGNSGGNLVDREQPVFVLASVALDDVEAGTIVEADGTDLKFARLKHSAAGQSRILEILDSDKLTDSAVVVSIFHKPFMTVTKIVDLLVEPLAYRDGVDLYEQGGNIAYSNLLYASLPALLGRNTFEDLCARFVEMVRSPSPTRCEDFFDLVDSLFRKHQQEELAGDLGVLSMTRKVAETDAAEWDGSDLDPAIPAFFEHASIWTGRLGRPFRVMHDKSKPIANEQVLLEAMMSPSETPRTIGYDRRTTNFPLTATGIDFGNSAQHAAIQLADIIAGSFFHCLRASIDGVEDAFANALTKTAVLNGPVRRVWPELKVTPEELGTVGPADPFVHEAIAGYAASRLGGFLPKGQRRKR